MHVPFTGIVSQDPIHHDFLLALREPALGPPPGFGLRGGRRHHEDGPYAYDEGEDAFEQEEPAPAFAAVVPA